MDEFEAMRRCCRTIDRVDAEAGRERVAGYLWERYKREQGEHGATLTPCIGFEVAGTGDAQEDA